MAELKLVSGEMVLLDDEDFEAMSKFRWYLSTDGYAATYQPTRYMHRMVMKTPKGMECDHRRHMLLDNRKSELRNTPKSGNMRNKRHKKDGTSRFKGVTWDRVRAKWRAQLKVGVKHLLCARFDSEIEAARAYDACALRVFGDFACVNGV